MTLEPGTKATLTGKLCPLLTHGGDPMSALAQRLVAHPRWRWHIGMVAESTRVYDVGKCFAGYEIPDIHHPSTKGWLLHMLRESGHGHQVLAREPFEGAALASALLAVWGEP